MKKGVFCLVLGCISLTACQFPRIYVVDSQGILSYDKHAGRLEVLWEHKVSTAEQSCDSVSTAVEYR